MKFLVKTDTARRTVSQEVYLQFENRYFSEATLDGCFRNHNLKTQKYCTHFGMFDDNFIESLLTERRIRALSII